MPGETFGRGSIPGWGTYFCVNCGAQLALHETDPVPVCPRCGRGRFRRDSLFVAHQQHRQATAEIELPRDLEPPEWLARTRASLAPGRYLAYEDEAGEVATVPIERGWTRIGRGPRCDVFLDDPSVSHRHALVVAEPGRGLRVLDDRSLNGVYVNGAAVELGDFGDGDRLTIGRFELHAICV